MKKVYAERIRPRLAGIIENIARCTRTSDFTKISLVMPLQPVLVAVELLEYFRV